MKNAFIYMFKDNKIWQKAGIYFIFVFLMLMCRNVLMLAKNGQIAIPASANIELSVIAAVIGMIAVGYQMCNIIILQQRDDNYVLPNINILKNLLCGFKYSIAITLLTLPLAVIFFVLIFGFIMSEIFIPVGLSQLIIYILIFTFALISVVYIAYYTPGYIVLFSKNEDLTTFYKFRELFGITSTKKYFISMAVLFLISILSFCITGINMAVCSRYGFIINVVMMALMSCFTTYIFFVVNHIIAKATVNIQKPTEV